MSPDNKTISINFTIGTMIRAVLIVGLAIMAYLLRDLFLIILTSVVIASSVETITLRLVRFGFPRVLAVLSIYFVSFAFIFGVLSFILPPIFSDLSDLSSNLPATISTIGTSATFDPVSSLTGGLAKSFSVKGLILELQKSIATYSSSFFGTASKIFGGVFSFILILVISFYLAVQERGIENFLRLITPIKNESYILDLWRRSQNKIGYWFQGQLVLGLIVGVIVFLGLTILEVKYALTLGILSALLEIIPFFGPIIAAVPAVLLGFGQGAGVGLMVLGLFIIVHQFENHLIYPLVVKKIIGVPPLLVILGMLVGFELAGFLGMVISVPLATVLMELVDDLEKHKLNIKQAINSHQNDSR